MATFNGVWKPTDASGGIQHTVKVAALAAGTSSAEISLGSNQIFSIVAFSNAVGTTTNNINVRFGPVGLGAATATDFGLPVGTPTSDAGLTYFDTGDSYQSIRVFNNSAQTVDIYVCKLSRI
jgi:hypothetical protein